jgi:hypothetical protein
MIVLWVIMMDFKEVSLFVIFKSIQPFYSENVNKKLIQVSYMSSGEELYPNSILIYLLLCVN